ncbi:MAG: cytochrome c [Acidobacteria bacterium]|nr:cytochrome c [Acidobacteriota bacterium]
MVTATPRIYTVFIGILAIAPLAALPAPASAQPTAGDATVTFAKDIVPIFQRSCQVCHRPGEMAPMSLVTYEDVRPWARSIRSRVVSREMPPWHIDRNIGIQQFEDDPSLSDAEIAMVAAWVDNGAPRGAPADMPPPRVFPDAAAWQIGEPDLIVKYPTIPVAAEGPDMFGSVYSPLELEEDRYIKAIQHRPVGEGSQRVVHHALSFVVDLDEQTQMPSASGHFLVEYAAGKGAEVFPEGIGVLLQAGKKLKLDYHLHPVGEQIDAVVELGIVLFPEGEQPEHIRWSKQLGRHSADLDIPAGELVRQDGYTMFQKAARILAFQPHMHTLGKYQCLELIYPTSGNQMRTETINCARFNYNWHLVYQYTDEAAPLVPAGTILHVISWHDNSDTNRVNPDPSNWVGNGITRTIDEMAFAWIGWHDLTQEEYEQAIEERKARRGQAQPTAQGQQ